LGFIEQRTSIYEQISKVYNELKLYTEVNKLAELADNKEYDQLKQALDFINRTYTKYVHKYPEDREIFDYVKDQYLIYLDLLKNQFMKDKSKESGKEVRDRIETIARKDDIQQDVLPAGFHVETPLIGHENDKNEDYKKMDIPVQDVSAEEQRLVGDMPEINAGEQDKHEHKGLFNKLIFNKH